VVIQIDESLLIQCEPPGVVISVTFLASGSILVDKLVLFVYFKIKGIYASNLLLPICYLFNKLLLESSEISTRYKNRTYGI